MNLGKKKHKCDTLGVTQKNKNKMYHSFQILVFMSNYLKTRPLPLWLNSDIIENLKKKI
jgi:hypothetical protein